MYMVNVLNNKINQCLRCVYNIYIYIYQYILSACSILNRIKIIKEIKDTMRNGIKSTSFCCILFSI